MALVGLAVVAYGALLAAQRWVVRPDDLPLWDAGQYILRAIRYRDLALAGDLSGLADFLATPFLRPPLHMGLMATWIAAFGATTASTRAFGAVVSLVALALLVRLGRRCDPVQGAACGALAAAATLVCVLQLQLLFTAMSEPTTLLVTVLGLGAAVQAVERPTAWAHLRVGLFVLLAAFTRYNVPLMLMAPLVVHHAWEHRRNPTALFDRRVSLWFVPLVVVFALWQFRRPELDDEIARFLRNKDSGIPLLSLENLGWIPRLLISNGFGSGWLVWPLLALFAAGLVPAIRGRGWAWETPLGRFEVGTDRRTRLLQIWVLGAITALLVHPLKEDRNVHGVVPFLLLATLLPWAGTRIVAALRWAATAAFAAFAAFQFTTALPAAPNLGTDYTRQAKVRAVLDFIGFNLKDAEWLYVGGWCKPLTYQYFELWMQELHRSTRVVVGWVIDPSLPGIDGATLPPLQSFTPREMFDPARVHRTLYVVFHACPASEKSIPGAEIVESNASWTEAQLDRAGIPMVDTIQIEGGMVVQAWRLLNPKRPPPPPLP